MNNRPCYCDKARIGYPYDPDKDCFLCFLALCTKEYGPVWGGKLPDNPQPIPQKNRILIELKVKYEEWPIFCKILKRFRDKEDIGIGDTIHRHLGKLGRDFSYWYEKLTGVPCGCVDRQKALNERFPYDRN